MSDLTPALIAPPAASRHWFDEAKAILTEGVGRWNDAKAKRNGQLGKFFYEAAIYCSKAQYAELEKVAVDGFNVGKDQITRFRTIYQREKELPAPTSQSRGQQNRSMEQPTSALARASVGGSPQEPSPAERGPDAEGLVAPPLGSGRTDVEAGGQSGDVYRPGPPTASDGSPPPALTPIVEPASEALSAVDATGPGSTSIVGSDGHGVQGEPGMAAPLAAFETPADLTTTVEPVAIPNPGGPDPLIGTVAAGSTPDPDTDTFGLRPTAGSRVDRLLAEVARLNPREMWNADRYLLAAARKILNAEHDRWDAFAGGKPNGKGSLHRENVEPRFGGKVKGGG